MRADHLATPDDSLQALASGEAPVLEALAQMQVGTLERSKLGEETYVLVRLAALVATASTSTSTPANWWPS